MGTAAHRDKDGVVQIDAQEPTAQLCQLGAGRDLALVPTLGAEKRTGLWAKKVVGEEQSGGTAVCCINVTLIFETYRSKYSDSDSDSSSSREFGEAWGSTSVLHVPQPAGGCTDLGA